MKRIERNNIFIWVCLVTAICFGICGLILPPLGVIDSSVLILIAQFLVFAAGLIFNSATVVKHIPYVNTKLKTFEDINHDLDSLISELNKKLDDQTNYSKENYLKNLKIKD